MTDEIRNNMVKIETSGGIRYVDRKNIISFEEGLLGFPDAKEFVFFDITECEPFKSMLSVQKNGPDFVVVETGLVFPEYNPLPYVSDVNVSIGNADDLVILSIVTLAEQPEDITANLSGPLLINLKTGKGRQVVLSDERFKTRQPMLVEV